MSIKDGDTVKVHYTGSLADGTVFDSSRERVPLEFVMGKGMLIPGFEAAIMGKETGDTVSVRIPPAEGYGDVDPDLVFTVARAQVPSHIIPEPGLQLQLSSDEGAMDVVVVEAGEDEIILDANHPLAGKELNFEIEVVSIG